MAKIHTTGNFIARTDVRPYVWTKEKPTEPGWYWYRMSHGQFIGRVYLDPEWYNAIADRFEPKLMFDDGSDMGHDPVEKCNDEWCGPIPEPAEGP